MKYSLDKQINKYYHKSYTFWAMASQKFIY